LMNKIHEEERKRWQLLRGKSCRYSAEMIAKVKRDSGFLRVHFLLAFAPQMLLFVQSDEIGSANIVLLQVVHARLARYHGVHNDEIQLGTCCRDSHVVLLVDSTQISLKIDLKSFHCTNSFHLGYSLHLTATLSY